jgi:hypothetical protein
MNNQRMRRPGRILVAVQLLVMAAAVTVVADRGPDRAAQVGQVVPYRFTAGGPFLVARGALPDDGFSHVRVRLRDVPAVVYPGDKVRFLVSLINTADHAIPLLVCPSYLMAVEFPTVSDEHLRALNPLRTERLNCAAIPGGQLPAHRATVVAMRLAIPALPDYPCLTGSAGERVCLSPAERRQGELGWHLIAAPSRLGHYASAPVTLRPAGGG